MIRLLPFILILLFASCNQADPKNAKAKEISNLEFKDITLAFDYVDTVEMEQFQEHISKVDNDAKFRLASKFINKFGDDQLTRYELTEIDTENKICIKHFTAFSPEADTAEYYIQDTLMQKVESREYYIKDEPYTVFKLLEIDDHMHSCNTSIVSPEFGFLYGKGNIGRYQISQHTDDAIAQELIRVIKSDSLFITCN